ncbi:MAG: LptF/LptG family permease [Alphaproteobacteria bacterium]|nr:LptF/LptG family permease [Alphaproteobacteria bacterium]MBL0718244.1 LptF/LptG family permease [Alphaproteobacteria bacterium]
MKIIQKIFLKELYRTFVIVFVVLTAIALVSQVAIMFQLFFSQASSPWQVALIIVTIIPKLAVFLMPFIIFITIILIFQKMILDNELIIFQSFGISLKEIYTLTLPFIRAVAIIHLVLLVVIEPMASSKARNIQRQLGVGLAQSQMQEKTFTNLMPGLVFYVRSLEFNRLNDVFIHDTRDANTEKNIFASHGYLVSTDLGLNLVLTSGAMHYEDLNKNLIIATFDVYRMLLNLPNQTKPSYKIKDQSLPSLIENIFVDNRRTESVGMILYRFFFPILTYIAGLFAIVGLIRGKILSRTGKPSILKTSLFFISITAVSLFSLFQLQNNPLFALLIVPLFISCVYILKWLVKERKCL